MIKLIHCDSFIHLVSSCIHYNSYVQVPDTCTCRGGWTGANCTECTPGEGCKHGSCTKPGECNCNENFTGMLSFFRIKYLNKIIKRKVTNKHLFALVFKRFQM